MDLIKMFEGKSDPIERYISYLTRRANTQLAYFILTRTDFELQELDINTNLECEEYGLSLFFGFEFITIKRDVPRKMDEVCKIREEAVNFLRRNEK